VASIRQTFLSCWSIWAVNQTAVDVLSHCPLCNSEQFRPYLICTDHLVSRQPFTIVECANCQLRFTNPRPAVNEIGSYYQSADYISHSDNQPGLVGSLYKLVRSYTLRDKVKLIDSLNHNAPGKLLDIGCGTGAFLHAARQVGWQVTGVEPDDKARLLASQRVNHPVVDTVDELSTTAKYDTITMWHVLEHIADLPGLLDSVSQKLAVNGHFIVAVPNSDSWDAQHYQTHWAAYDVPRHLYHFTPDVMLKLADRFGFRMVRQRPMYFDAFYIGMLSSKHRDGKTNYPEAVLNGIRSNWQARKSGNYSSIVYLMQLA
jgi:2-polyprenyl-3-methyl-5-hydroxy-6-metoxy-1,4-benzoquinol methylase